MPISKDSHDVYNDNVPLRDYAADHGRRSKSPSPKPTQLNPYGEPMPEALHAERQDTLQAADFLLKHPGIRRSPLNRLKPSVLGVGLPLKKLTYIRHQQDFLTTIRMVRRERSR